MYQRIAGICLRRLPANKAGSDEATYYNVLLQTGSRWAPEGCDDDNSIQISCIVNNIDIFCTSKLLIMKISVHIHLVVAVLLMSSLSCTREKCIDENPQHPSKGNLIRIQQGTGANTKNDTVKLITYDHLHRISTVADSIHKYTMFAYYDVSGRISAIIEKSGSAASDSARMYYDGAGLLTRYDFTNAGQKNRYILEYQNGVVAKKTYYSDHGSGGPLNLSRYSVYQVTAGNITGIKEYSQADQLISETKLTYGAALNPFKDISLFNFANKLGTADIINFETYFSKNILTGYQINSLAAETVMIENVFNGMQKPVKIVSKIDFLNHKFDYIFTRYFSYN